MSSNKPIGGYFEMESHNLVSSIYHNKAIAVNSARNALEYILLINNYKKIFIPYYTCDVILQPLKRLNIDFEYYYLDNDFYPIIESIKTDEALLYVNYFGMMNNVVYSLSTKFRNLIVDNAHAFFAKPLKGISTFYSPRKFFGLPDGGFVYPNKILRLKLDIDKSIDRISHLIARVENGAEAGFNLFKENELKLDNLPLKSMSNFTKKLLFNIDYNVVLQQRNKNFSILHQVLKHNNELTPIIENEDVNGAMVYPYLRIGNNKLTKKLIENKIFIAKYWPNVIDWVKNKNTTEIHFVNNLIPLPIDQRYGEKEMERILNLIVRNKL